MKTKVVPERMPGKDERGDLMRLLKRHRLAQGLTQKKLGLKVGRSASSVCDWESGATIPEAEIIPKLARALGIPPLELTKVISPEQPMASRAGS